MNEMNDMNGLDMPSFAELYRVSKVMHVMNKKMSFIEELLGKLSQLQDCRQKKILGTKIRDEYLKVARLKSLLEEFPVQDITIV